MNGRNRSRNTATLRRRIALSLSAVMVGTLLQATVAPAAATADSGKGRPELPQAERPIAGSDADKAKPRTVEKGPRTPQKVPKASWPKPGKAQVQVPAASLSRSVRPEPVKAKGLPIEVGLPGAMHGSRKGAAEAQPEKDLASGPVEVRVLNRKAAEKAGANGLLFAITLEPGAEAKDTSRGKAGVRLDYSGFAQAYGGDYASRLTLVALPACALTTPGKKVCTQRTPVSTVNDTDQQTLTVDSLALRSSEPTVLAAVAEEAGSKGDYKASKLAPSATWKTNLNTGDFSWSYDMPAPDVPGGFKPSVGLSYSSGQIDGRTGGTNNQASWVGDGFDLWPGYIERRYQPCSDDGVEHSDGNKPGDMCWKYDNAFITFNGKGGELVPVGDNEWKLKQDDGTRIERLTSSNRHNGDDNGEYWRLKAPDGTRYYFGFHRLPGWNSGDEETGSTWTSPVFGDDSGEPCHAAAFKDSWCQQAWRWNLDYAVDTHGNAVAYYYDQEKNSYGRNLEETDDTRYVRGGSLDRIEYGLKSSSMYGAEPLAKLDFTSSERCIPKEGVTCAPETVDDKSYYWYDTPWDLNCNVGTDCDQGRYSPSFWTRKRLTGVTSYVRDGDAYTKVDSWELTHRWGTADVDYQLLLDSVQHTGHAADPAITLPKTTFAYTQLENRLDKTGDGYAPFVKARLSTVADEYGGQIDANYSSPACSFSNLPTPESNTTRCYPQYIGGSASDAADREWFNKYVVTSVTATDRTGGSPDQVTRYSYLGGAAWHYDESGLAKDKERTWSEWRGYGHVRVRTGGQGGADAMKSQEDSYFLRGMDGDRANKDGGTKEVTVALGTDEGNPIADHESAAGFTYKTAAYTGPAGKVLTKTVNRPWSHKTGSKTHDWATLRSHFTGTSHSKTWTSLDEGAGSRWRITSQSNAFDTVGGRPVQTNDHGDNSTSSDNRCLRTTYATNTEKNILSLPAREETVAAGCGDTPDRSKDVISDKRTAYDGGDYGAAPTKGDVTATAGLKDHDGTTATYLESRATFDAYGRQLTATDLTADVTATVGGATQRTPRSDGRTTTTAYSPASGFATKVTTTTPPAKAGDASTAQITTAEFRPGQSKPVAEEDTNGKRTTVKYDALGRTWLVWLPNRYTTQHPNYQVNYSIEEGKPAAVATRTLTTSGGNQIASYTLYDGLLRERQTQQPGPDGGRLVSDVFYDERGLKAKTFAPYYVEGAPSRALFAPDDALSVETQMRHAYDGLGRETEAKQIAGNGDGGEVLAVTKTLYGGDRTTVIPPQGGTTTTTLTDARGRTTQLRQHQGSTPGSIYDTTAYAYTPRGELSKLTDPAGNQWTYSYDQLGRKIRTVDPDNGPTTTTYDDRGNVVSTTDARGRKLVNVYDGLNRRTELREGTASGELRARWTYDTIPGAQGHLAQSTRYVDGNAYVRKVTKYDRLYQVERAATVIPEAEGALAGTYQEGTARHINGLTAGRSFSLVGNIGGKGWSYTYEDDTLRPVAVFTSGARADVTYSLTGKPLQYELGGTSGAKKSWVTNTYEWGTQRLATSRVDRQDIAGVDRHNTYEYDPMGNVRSVSDISRDGTDTQCFTYDYLRRLTEAWTEGTKTCTDAPADAAVGGPAPYWHSYTYDKAGNRLTETQHDPVDGASQDVTRTFDYPAPGTSQPHTLTTVDQTGPTGTSRDTYAYDEAGNTTSRTLSGDTQNLTWDAEGRLAHVTEPVEGGEDEDTEYVYDADGNRLISRGPTESTFYWGDHTEVTVANGSDAIKATRYIPLGGGHQAVLADDGTWTITVADHHGTDQLAIDAASLELTQRRELPFGGPRGDEPASWPTSRGFVGGIDDTETTGLVHLGAREYDPTTGRFISVDPVMDPADPQQMHGYTYSNNNPLTFSDPSGMLFLGVDGLGHGVVANANGGGSHLSGTGNSHYYNPNIYWDGKGSDYPTLTYTKQGDLTVNGQRVPTERELKKYGPTATYQENVQAWAQGRCHDPAEQDAFCKGAEMLGWVSYETTGDILEILGVRDAIACAKGSASGCAWLAVGLTPAGKAAKLLKAAKGAKAGKGGKGAKCVSHSFVPGTGVLLSDGTYKEIEDVQVGDMVAVTDPETGETTTREVVGTIVTEDDKQFVDLTVSTDGGESASLVSTTTHPFWSPSESDWVDAGDLAAGMTLRTDNGDTVEVAATRHFTKRQRTHDLTIADIHTYYVLAGKTPVLVHNSNGACGANLTRGEKVAAATGVDDLSPALRKNLTGFMKKSPGDAEIPQIIRLPGGGAEFSYKVPGRVPGSYAMYRKRVDSEGGTELAYKTTFLPDGSIAHIKFK